MSNKPYMWCTTHNREATAFKNERYCCDDKLDGILLPCNPIPIKNASIGLELSLFRALDKKAARGWPKFYWAIDLHDTIFRSTYSKDKSLVDLAFCNDYCKTFLQWLSSQKDHVMILYTSTYKKDLDRLYVDTLEDNDIYFDYLNENPDCPSTELSDFSRKFYFDMLLDDKACFNIHSDWKVLVDLIPYIEAKMCGTKNVL